MNLSELINSYDELPLIGLYGTPGIGKTTSTILTAPKPMIWFDSENSLASVLNDTIVSKYKDELDMVKYVKINNLIDVKAYLRSLQQQQQISDYKTILIDSYTVLQEKFIYKDVISGAVSAQDFKYKIQDWAKPRSLSIDIFISIKILAPKALKIFTFAEKISEWDPESIKPKPRYVYQPELQGRSGDKMFQYFDEIWRMYTHQGERYIQVRETDKTLLGGTVNALCKSRNAIQANAKYNLMELFPNICGDKK